MNSLYIHVPFCVRKCHYCGFYSTALSVTAVEDYIAALGREAASFRDKGESALETVYIGGGTPSILTPPQLENIISSIQKNFSITSDAEFTIEANPNSITTAHLKLLREQGVNRISLGIQSFSDQLLHYLGRLHTTEHALDAFRKARQHGFNNISIDLIFGIPGQTQSLWAETLDHVQDLRPEHISVYSLSLDEGAWFNSEADSGNFFLPDEDQTAEQYEFAVNTLIQAGYEHYEISNFSLPGFACGHNLNYWRRGEYLGLGPGAWSFIAGLRYKNIADVQEYCRRVGTQIPLIDDEDRPTPEQAGYEQVLLALRTSYGLDLRQFNLTYGSVISRQLAVGAEPLKHSGLLVENAGRLRMTTRGFLLSNEVLTRLFL